MQVTVSLKHRNSLSFLVWNKEATRTPIFHSLFRVILFLPLHYIARLYSCFRFTRGLSSLVHCRPLSSLAVMFSSFFSLSHQLFTFASFIIAYKYLHEYLWRHFFFVSFTARWACRVKREREKKSEKIVSQRGEGGSWIKWTSLENGIVDEKCAVLYEILERICKRKYCCTVKCIVFNRLSTSFMCMSSR